MSQFPLIFQHFAHREVPRMEQFKLQFRQAHTRRLFQRMSQLRKHLNLRVDTSWKHNRGKKPQNRYKASRVSIIYIPAKYYAKTI